MADQGTALAEKLEQILRASPLVSRILEDWHVLDLPDVWLVAGCIGQTVWNDRYGFAPTYGFRDVDLVYFDPADLSKAAEQDHAARIRDAFSDLHVKMPIKLDVKNEARVHLWYEQKFGYSIPPYPSVKAAIDTFPATAGCVGVRPQASGQSARYLCALWLGGFNVRYSPG